MEESAQPPKEAESEPKPDEPDTGEKRSRRGLWITLAIVVVLVSAGVVLVAMLPGIIEAQIRKALADLELERTEFEMGAVTLSGAEIREVDFAGKGWELQTPLVKAGYSIPSLLRKRLGSLDLSNAAFELDLDGLEPQEVSHDDGAASTEDGPSGFTLSKLAGSLPVERIDLENTVIHLRRGELLQELGLSGYVSLAGQTDVRVVGTGASALEVGVTGNMNGANGKADLVAEMSIASFPVLLELANLEIEQEGLDLKFGTLEGSGEIQVRADEFGFGEVDIQVDLEGLTYDDFKLGATQLQVNHDSGFFLLTSGDLDAAYEPDVSGRGTVEAKLKPGATFEESLLEGVIHVASMELFGIPLSPFDLPVKGNLNTLHFGPGSATSPDFKGLVLADVEFDVEDMTKPVIHGNGTGVLGVQLPGFAANPPHDLNLEGAVAMPVLANFKVAPDEQAFSIKLDLPKETATGQDSEFELKGVGNAELQTRFAGEKSEVDLNLDISSLEWSEAGEQLAILEDLQLQGKLTDGNGSGEGSGSLNGKSFPISLTHETEGATQNTRITIDSIALREETWVGELIEGWEGSKLSGDIKVEATFETSGEAVSPQITASLTHGSLEYPDGETSATGVTAAVEVASLDPLKLAPRTTVRVDRISTPADIDVTGVRLSFSVLEGGATRLNSFSAQVFGGEIALSKSVTIPAGGTGYTLPISLKSIKAAQIMEFFPQFEGEIDAAVSGQIPIGVTKTGNLEILVGTLELDSNYPAVLRYDATGLLTKDLKERSRAFKINQQVERALGNLSIDGLEVSLLDQSNSEHRAVVKLNGVGVDESVKVPVTLNVRVEDKEDILRKILDNVVFSGINLSF
tara:strand:+ start:15265 stop:17838 length:2574 start_codon:yes stop_codon:yes gene_type:complete